MSRHSAIRCLVVPFLLAALAGCGGIGDSAFAPKKCISIHDGGCVEPEAFREAAPKPRRRAASTRDSGNSGG